MVERATKRIYVGSGSYTSPNVFPQTSYFQITSMRICSRNTLYKNLASIPVTLTLPKDVAGIGPNSNKRAEGNRYRRQSSSGLNNGPSWYLGWEKSGARPNELQFLFYIYAVYIDRPFRRRTVHRTSWSWPRPLKSTTAMPMMDRH